MVGAICDSGTWQGGETQTVTSKLRHNTDLEELPFVGRRPQPADIFQREPADADGLYGGEVRVVGVVFAVDRRQGVDC